MSGRLYILAGMPGSGKTTWAENVMPHLDRVSSDDIRIELYGSLKEAHRQRANAKVFDLFHLRIRDYLEAGDDVIADATSLEKDARKRLLAIAEEFDADVHLILFTNMRDALERNRQRDDDLVVPDEVMGTKMLPRLRETEISIVEKGENKLYDSVTFINNVS